ncbi:MAG: malate dehydrogenase [Rickettsiales bacterium]|nr:malate dehydrogenase [Rickettsiales bacterium]
MKSNELYEKSALYHKNGRAGKIAIELTKPMNTREDLSLAYSPGVAGPCLEIQEDYNKVYDYTSKGNSVAVITNGTAVLGLGNIGAAAGKPVMEGKAALFKKFANIDAIDLLVDTENPEEFVNCVKLLGQTWGGINLEDIKAPECFYIEEKLRELMDIPVFHDDQHGTAIVVSAGIINALELIHKDIKKVKIVINGAGAAAMACYNLIKSIGAQNIIICDSKGVIYKGRTDGMNSYKEKVAVDTSFRLLEDAISGADVFLGLSKADVLTAAMLQTMAENPIVFAMANPNPEISPELAKQTRKDVIMATGRSDYPNQINNLLAFPYIFRGALDVRATKIVEEMKIAAVKSIAEIAKLPVPKYVCDIYNNPNMSFGREYIIPTPFDKRLLTEIAVAVAKSACMQNVAKKPISDWESYKVELEKKVYQNK